MMEADLVIRNGTVLPGDGTVVEGVGIAVKGDRIAAICLQEELPPARRVIDARGKHVVPGLIDPHVHTRAPGYESKEDFETCSAAAAAGGITTILAMFNVEPPTISLENFQVLIGYGNAHTMVNFNAHGLIIESNLNEIPKMADAGISSIKFLMGYKFDISGTGGRSDVKGLACPSDGVMLDAMRIMAETRLPLSCHAENEDIIHHLQSVLKAQGRNDPLVHLAARPNVAEEEAISRLIIYTRACGNKLHILHLPGREGVRLVRQAQEEGLAVTSETCPHYLLMTHEEHMPKYGSVAKINPPIRSRADQDALWEGIRLGGIDVIGTDHSPHGDEEKMVDRPHDDIWKAMAGFVGVETSVPLMLTEVNKGRLALTKLVDLCSTNVARLFGLYPDRGTLRVGGAADITILDLRREGVIDRRKLHSKTTVTPFHGWKVRGMPTHTIVNGKVVYEEGTIRGKPGDGRFISAHFAH
jgi:allantoinase